MAVKKANDKVETPAINLSPELIKEIQTEQKELIDSILEYELPEELEDKAEPLTFKEKRELSKKHKLQEIDTMEDKDLDDLIGDMLEKRHIADIDNLKYSDLQMWVRKIIITTFNTKVIATKK